MARYCLEQQYKEFGNTDTNPCKQELMLKMLFQEGIAPWHTAFYLTAGLLLFESLVFGLFASGVEQPWNRQSMDNSAEMKLEGHEKQEKNER